MRIIPLKLKLLEYLPIIEKILLISNELIKEAYISELLNDFINTILKSTPEGHYLDFNERLIIALSNLLKIEYTKDLCPMIEEAYNKIRIWDEIIKDVLNGKKSSQEVKNVFIPLLENVISQDEKILGHLETLTIKVIKSKTSNQFIIVPSEKELEYLIDEQIKISWNLAIIYAKNYNRKIDEFHEVIIQFNSRIGFCRGNSLGLALTIKFIEELLKLYNSKFLIEVTERIAITGGINENGKVLQVGKEIITKKIELIFYSSLEKLVLSKEDEVYAWRSLIN